MNLNFSAQDQAFRQEVRTFIARALPADIQHKVVNGLILERDDYVRWQQALHAQGWGGSSWAREFGGTGWSAVQKYIFEEEVAAAGAPRIIPFGVKMVAPVIMAFGSPAQQQRFLPKILSAEEWWCQGYSEPGSGSDLASVQTAAQRDGDHYLVNGQKTWTTQAQYADWIFCLVRTDREAKPQRGISFLLIDMKTPGITVRPIITMDGAHEVNEVWFDNVRVPVENLVGEENAGWTYAKFLLGHERTNIAGIGIAKRELARLKRIASQETKHGKALIQDPQFALRIAQIQVDLTALEITNLRVLSAEEQRKTPGPEASILKIKGTEIQQAITELMTQAVGLYALPLRRDAMAAGYQGEHAGPAYATSLAANYLNMRKLSIYGGSNEIQKNIIAQMILGL
ncbi:acyl-CoA dehydrogenase family protein [Undibacterium sp. Jales W-56]|uniref:acyl-CoA dehydrogenase family protein n=1 Tax=Undibacterium sp. Jales W-56 TaxID=2897325 RepID=UPI0021D1B87E|nr:acyl-CoA dehydrogenase family protein [Undibacterium sp. Jales W-56]MCU6432327.1 acyl-CoA dehydrogenase family protein [Undibacterium sp. Jales W-56]